ncbi:MAG: (2Fe-2S)-binding protein, partial [Spirochaetaceae bacterium]|nr:(2Fe-2S)-binding protein [Spirochaetaceae bacterium]
MDGDNMVHLTINERKIAVTEGISVLRAALEQGIFIPTLCHLEDLSPSGACRLCIVEISNPSRNPDKSWIDSACVCPVSEGLSIQTDSPKVRRQRKLI